MKPIKFKEANCIMVCAPDMVDCEDVTAFITDKTVMTVWKPSKTDLERLMQGNLLLLHVWGQSMPPLVLSVADDDVIHQLD